MGNEIWVDVLDYEGLYKASDFGNIKSLKYGKERILKPRIDSRGYYIVDLWKYNKQSTVKVHRLVYEAFNGKTDLQIDHIIEGNKLDNRLCNLQAVTQRENTSKYHLSTKKSSKYTGVCWVERYQKWVARIYQNGKSNHLGYFNTEYEAHIAYQTSFQTLNQIGTG